MKLLIDGKKVDSSNGKIIEIIDPTSESLDSVSSASLDDMDQAWNAQGMDF